MKKREPKSTEPVRLEDGSQEWSTDPDFEPVEVPEQLLTPVEDDATEPDPGTSETDEEVSD